MTALETARKALASARTIERNQRLGRYNGRNAVATDQNLSRHYGRAVIAERELSRELRGLVWAEHDLAIRLQVARESGQERPELQERVRVTRRRIRELA